MQTYYACFSTAPGFNAAIELGCSHATFNYHIFLFNYCKALVHRRGHDMKKMNVVSISFKFRDYFSL